jgi:hypothetical protein
MKTQRILIASIIILFITISGFSQVNQKSKWIIDGNSFFSSQSVLNSEKSDTVVFFNVSFVSEYLKVNDVEKITYNKKTKKLEIVSKDKGSIVMSDGKNGMKLVSDYDLNKDTWKKVKYIEYTIGDHSAYVK